MVSFVLFFSICSCKVPANNPHSWYSLTSRFSPSLFLLFFGIVCDRKPMNIILFLMHTCATRFHGRLCKSGQFSAAAAACYIQGNWACVCPCMYAAGEILPVFRLGRAICKHKHLVETTLVWTMHVFFSFTRLSMFNVEKKCSKNHGIFENNLRSSAKRFKSS